MFTISNQANLDAARIGFHAAFLEQLGLVERNALEALFMEVQSGTTLEEWQWLGDLPDFQEWKGDRLLAGLEAFKLQIRNKDWAGGVYIHQNDFKDDRLGLIAPKIQGLAKRFRTHRARLAVKCLIAGMGTGAYPEVSNGLAYDGKNYFDTTHATGSNKLTTALSSAGLDSALQLLQGQTSYDTVEPLEIGMGQLTLVVGPKLFATAEKLRTSDYLGSATSTETNFWKNRFDLVTSGYLRGTFDDWWFLFDLTQPVKPFIFQLREEISMSSIMGNQGGENDSLPRFIKGHHYFGGEARYNVAPFEFRLGVGSQVA